MDKDTPVRRLPWRNALAFAILVAALFGFSWLVLGGGAWRAAVFALAITVVAMVSALVRTWRAT
jgi:hypothetical protein